MKTAALPPLRAKILGKTAQLGTFIGIPHPSVVEIAAFSDLDFLTLDGEHAPLGRSEIEDLIRAADAAGIATIVRVPDLQGGWIGTALDAGAVGILMPLVSSADEAKAVVRACRFPPVGARGVGPGRATRYGGDILTYVGGANDAVLVAVQIETVEGLANVAAIAAVEGVDVVFIGPGDLSVSLGALGPAGKPKLDAAIDEIVAAARAARKQLGMFVANPADTQQWVDRGFTFIIVGSDMLLLHQGYGALQVAARGANAKEQAA